MLSGMNGRDNNDSFSSIVLGFYHKSEGKRKRANSSCPLWVLWVYFIKIARKTCYKIFYLNGTGPDLICSPKRQTFFSGHACCKLLQWSTGFSSHYVRTPLSCVVLRCVKTFCNIHTTHLSSKVGTWGLSNSSPPFCGLNTCVQMGKLTTHKRCSMETWGSRILRKQTECQRKTVCTHTRDTRVWSTLDVLLKNSISESEHFQKPRCYIFQFCSRVRGLNFGKGLLLICNVILSCTFSCGRTLPQTATVKVLRVFFASDDQCWCVHNLFEFSVFLIRVTCQPAFCSNLAACIFRWVALKIHTKLFIQVWGARSSSISMSGVSPPPKKKNVQKAAVNFACEQLSSPRLLFWSEQILG